MTHTVRSIQIEMTVYPTSMQDVPAGQTEIENIRSFIADVESFAEKRLPKGRHTLKITEHHERTQR